MLFPKGETKFIRPDGSIGRAPGHGIVLLGMGETANTALQRSELGLFVVLRRPLAEPQPIVDQTRPPITGTPEPVQKTAEAA
jgi:hypothetical protein